METQASAEPPTIREYSCGHCSAVARGFAGKGSWDRTFYAQFHDAGYVCSACGAFLCQAHRDEVCKAAGVSKKDCPVCRQKKAWDGVVTSPPCEPREEVSGSCVVCAAPVEGRVLTPEETAALPLAARTPKTWMCYHCGTLLCSDHLVETVACPSCGSLRPFTGIVVPAEAVAKDVSKSLERIMRDADEWRKPDDEADRKRYDAALAAERSDILSWSDAAKRDPVALARLVELGREDLATDDVVESLAGADPTRIRTLGRIAVATRGKRAVEALEAATRSQNSYVRAVALSYLSDFRDEPRTRTALTRALCDRESVSIDALNQRMPGIDYYWGLRNIARGATLGLVNRSDVPEVPIAKLASSALKECPGGPDFVALAEILTGTAKGVPYGEGEAGRALYDAFAHSGGGGSVDEMRESFAANADKIGAAFRDSLDESSRQRHPGLFDAIVASDSIVARDLAVHRLLHTDDPSADAHLATLCGDREKSIAKLAAKTLAKREKRGRKRS